MTRSVLRSAILEVGLFYEKGWSAERIAKFTYRLRRRRAREAAAHDGHGRGQAGEWLAVPFRIDAALDPWIAYDLAHANGAATNGSGAEVLADRLPSRLEAQG